MIGIRLPVQHRVSSIHPVSIFKTPRKLPVCFPATKNQSVHKKLPSLHPIDDSSEYEDAHAFSHFSNWVIPGHLMVGRYPYVEPSYVRRCDTHEKGILQLERIINADIRTFICLQAELPEQRTMSGQAVKGFQPYLPLCQSLTDDRIDAVHIPIVDLSIPSTALLNATLNEMEDRLRSGEKMYMHCWGGRGRAGLVACCLLSKAYKISAEESLERIGRGYLTRGYDGYRSPQTNEQIDFVKQFSTDHC